MPRRHGNRIRLSLREKSWYSQVYEAVGAEVPFWVVETEPSNARALRDDHGRRLQEVVARFSHQALFVQIGKRHPGTPALEGTLDLRGQTDRRQLVRLLYHAQGVLCTSAKLQDLATRVACKPGDGRARLCATVTDPRAYHRLQLWFTRQHTRALTRKQRQLVEAALARQRHHHVAGASASRQAMLDRVFAVACDGNYFAGLRALLNSIAVYHGRDIPTLVYHRGLSPAQLRWLREHPAGVHLFAVEELPFPCPGMWEAKQQILAHCLGRARLVYLLDADLVLVSAVDDVFELARAGKIVSSRDGRDRPYAPAYAAYSAELPGVVQPYINSGALCLDVVRHWDLAGLWAFAAQYAAYTHGGGLPLGLPGHGDQGVFNALAAVLRKAPCFQVLPEPTWCDSTLGCAVAIRRRLPSGALQVWNATTQAWQRLVHSSGSKWWTLQGANYLRHFGDKLQCFRHFARWRPKPRRKAAVLLAVPPANGRVRLLIGICSCAEAQARRAAIRATWLAQVPDGTSTVFFAGGGAALKESNMVRLVVHDGYACLPQKVQAFFRYAVGAYQFDYLFKCDDDTFVAVERLLELTRLGAEYVGSTAWASKGYGSGGAGYLLSRRAVEHLARARTPGCGAEDVWVGRVLREAGIRFHPTPRLRIDHRKLPQPENDLISAHWCSPQLMEAIHAGFQHPGATKAAAHFFARHPLWQGPLTLLRGGVFVAGGRQPHGRWQTSAGGRSLVLEWFHRPKEILRQTRFGYAGTHLRLETTHADDPRPKPARASTP